MSGALSKEIENRSKTSKNTGLRCVVIFSGGKTKCVGAGISGGGHVGPTRQGACPGGGRALDPRGQVVAPPGVFSVPDILKYSTKKHISISGHLENFYFRGIFLLHG